MAARPLSQKPVLVGINITNNEKTVLLIDPRASSQGQNRRAEIKRVGDVYQGHTIADIAPDHIVLESASGESGSRKDKTRPGRWTPQRSADSILFRVESARRRYRLHAGENSRRRSTTLRVRGAA